MSTLIAALLALLAMSAFFSASETALTSLNKVKVRSLVERFGSRFDILGHWLDDPARYLTAILIGNNIVNVAAASLAAALAISLWGERGVAIATGVTTFMLLVFAEIVPKTFARHHHERTALFFFRPLYVLARLLNPLVRFFVFIADLVIRLFGGHLSPETGRISKHDIQALIELGEQEGALAESEREIINSVIEFRETVVSNVMTPRVDIVAVSERERIGDCLAIMVREGHSRFPVYGQGMDDIRGVLDYRQINQHLADGERDVLAGAVMRPAYFVPEGMRVSALLREFQRRKVHLAIVMDEFGGTSGLVTLEDLLEEIVGEIADEHEQETAGFQQVDERTYRVHAKMEIEKVSELLGTELDENEKSETAGGFVLNHLGRIPAVGEQFRFQNLLFTVEQADERSVSQLLVQKLTPRPSA